MTDTTEPPPPSVLLKVERADDFQSIYANNIYLEPNAWDLKIIFGQVEQQPDGTGVAKQRIAITIPWAQAKLALYWLRVQVEGTEIQCGKIGIRKDLIPPEPPPIPAGQENNQDIKAIHEMVKRVREEFLERL